MTKIFVSGANSFIGGHVIAQLIADGYSVTGSVRSAEKGEQVKKAFPKNFEYVIIPDITKSDAYDEALKSIPDLEGFFNVLSPVNHLPDFEKDTIVPAIENVKNVLHSLKKYAPKLKRFVHTSSASAMVPYNTNIVEVSENTWNDQPRETCSTPTEAYNVSKALSERAIWDFFQKEKPSFSFNIINPALVLGPEYFEGNIKKTGSSLSVFGSLLTLKKGDQVPLFLLPIVDVRDLAIVHVQAFTSEVTSKRYLIAYEIWTSFRFVTFIKSKFPELELPEVDPNGDKTALDSYPKVVSADTGLKYISIEQCILDTYTDYIKKELLA